MKLQDYIHYYLHCDFWLTNLKQKTRITNFWPQPESTEYCIGYGLDDVNGVADIKDIKPILRKLEDASPEEIGQFRLIRDSITNRIEKCAAVTKYLTSINIDVFGLIKSGLAIDSKTLK